VAAAPYGSEDVLIEIEDGETMTRAAVRQHCHVAAGPYNRGGKAKPVRRPRPTRQDVAGW
jgi:hypothetical protein